MKSANTVDVFRFETKEGKGVFSAGVDIYHHASCVCPDHDFNDDDVCPNPNNELKMFVFKGSRKITVRVNPRRSVRSGEWMYDRPSLKDHPIANHMRNNCSEYYPWSGLCCACEADKFFEWFPRPLVEAMMKEYDGKCSVSEDHKYYEMEKSRAESRHLTVRKYTVPADQVAFGTRQALFNKEAAVKVEEISLDELAALAS